MCIHHNAKITMEKIQAAYRLKQGIEIPNMFLGTDIRKCDFTEEDGPQRW